MKLHTALLLVLSLFATTSIAQAEAFAGEDSARHYKSNPEKYDGETVDVDCVYVKRLPGAKKIEGVVFFLVHTKDADNRVRGGSIIAAVLEAEADKFIRKYGNTVDIDRGASIRVDSKRLRATFHQLERGRVYLDASEGPANELIEAHLEAAIGAIRSGDGVPAAGAKGKFKKKKL